MLIPTVYAASSIISQNTPVVSHYSTSEGIGLVREARRANAARGELLAWGGGRLWAERPLRWPARLATPRARLHAGGLAVAATGAVLARPELAVLALVGWGVWLASSVRRRAGVVGPVACDESGRSLPIEALR